MLVRPSLENSVGSRSRETRAGRRQPSISLAGVRQTLATSQEQVLPQIPSATGHNKGAVVSGGPATSTSCSLLPAFLSLAGYLPMPASLKLPSQPRCPQAPPPPPWSPSLSQNMVRTRSRGPPRHAKAALPRGCKPLPHCSPVRANRSPLRPQLCFHLPSAFLWKGSPPGSLSCQGTVD